MLSKIYFTVSIDIRMAMGGMHLNTDYELNMKNELMKVYERKCIINKDLKGFLLKIINVSYDDHALCDLKGNVVCDFKLDCRMLCVKENDIIICNVLKSPNNLVLCDRDNGALLVISNNNYDEEKFVLNRSDELTYKKSGNKLKIGDEVKVKLMKILIENKSDKILAEGIILDIIV